MSKPILSPDETYLEIGKPDEFQRFYQQFIELLKTKLRRINIGDSGNYYFRRDGVATRSTWYR